MNLKFEKENNGRWYVVLPDWEGEHEDLEMVFGADEMLDYLSAGKSFVSIDFFTDDETPSENEQFVKACLVEHDNDGATYQPVTNEFFNKPLWLCNVVHHVLGEHPQTLYIKI